MRYRKARIKASRWRRLENKRKREAEKLAKAKAWAAKKENEIIYLGEGVSVGLSEKEDNKKQLDRFHLPIFANEKALAKQMGIALGELRFLAFQRKVSKVSHYQRFQIPKKRGGFRSISAPMPRLKAAQNWILENILYQVPLHPAAHGFVPGKSIVTNAQPHVKAETVINLDLKNFFLTITYPRVKGVFRSLGYSEHIAIILALICTEADVEEIKVHEEPFFVQSSERHLPQGAPSSPGITNILCIRMDKRLKGAADKLGFTYTRYADDLTFSTQEKDEAKLKKMLWQAKKIVEDEGFVIHPEKERIMRTGQKKEVTGIVVNDKLSLDRKTLKRFRALLFQLEKDGPAGKHWNQSHNLLASVKGYAHYIAMVNPEKGAQIVERAEKVLLNAGFKHQIHFFSQAQRDKAEQRKQARRPIQRSQEEKPWWKFW